MNPLPAKFTDAGIQLHETLKWPSFQAHRFTETRFSGSDVLPKRRTVAFLSSIKPERLEFVS
jgi:hypothetical protein